MISARVARELAQFSLHTTATTSIRKNTAVDKVGVVRKRRFLSCGLWKRRFLSSIYSLQFAFIKTIKSLPFFSLIFKTQNFNIYFSGPAVFHAPPPPPTAAYDEDDQENMPVFLAPSPPDGPVFIPPSPPNCPPSTDGSDEEYELSSCAGLQIFCHFDFSYLVILLFSHFDLSYFEFSYF